MWCTAKYKGLNLEIKDSYRLIPMALKCFGKTFNLDQQKEVIAHEIYTPLNIERVFIDIYEAKPYLNKDQYKQLKKNIKDWEIEACGKFNILQVKFNILSLILISNINIYNLIMYLIFNI